MVLEHWLIAHQTPLQCQRPAAMPVELPPYGTGKHRAFVLEHTTLCTEVVSQLPALQQLMGVVLA